MDPTHASTPPAPAPAIRSAPTAAEQCAGCGAPLAPDQRYCLECGQRRGDPRLPFMDAVVLMDAVRRPRQEPAAAPAKPKRGGISPNAALITGVGVLLLALGIGVLIGQSGGGTTVSAPQTPQVITVGGSSEGGEEDTAAKAKAVTGGGNGKAHASQSQKAKALQEAEAEPAAEEVLKPAGDVKLPPAKVKPGGDCEAGAAGCEDGEFTGDFFGE